MEIYFFNCLSKGPLYFYLMRRIESNILLRSLSQSGECLLELFSFERPNNELQNYEMRRRESYIPSFELIQILRILDIHIINGSPFGISNPSVG